MAIDPHAGGDRGPQEISPDARSRRGGPRGLPRQPAPRGGRRRRAPRAPDVAGRARSRSRGRSICSTSTARTATAPARADIERWGARVAPGGTMLVHDAYNAVGVMLAQLRVLFLSARWRYVGRTRSLAEYRREELDRGRARCATPLAPAARAALVPAQRADQARAAWRGCARVAGCSGCRTGTTGPTEPGSPAGRCLDGVWPRPERPSPRRHRLRSRGCTLAQLRRQPPGSASGAETLASSSGSGLSRRYVLPPWTNGATASSTSWRTATGGSAAAAPSSGACCAGRGCRPRPASSMPAAAPAATWSSSAAGRGRGRGRVGGRRRVLPPARPGRRPMRAPLDELPYDDGRFGLILATDVIEHLDDDRPRARRAPAGGEDRRAAGRDGARLLVALERARRVDAPPPPLHAPAPAEEGRRGGLAADGALLLLQRPASGRGGGAHRCGGWPRRGGRRSDLALAPAALGRALELPVLRRGEADRARRAAARRRVGGDGRAPRR